jgi:hypothetical protein
MSISSLEIVVPGGGVEMAFSFFCAPHTEGVKCWLLLTISCRFQIDVYPPPSEFVSGPFVDILNCGRHSQINGNLPSAGPFTERPRLKTVQTATKPTAVTG